jgi:hypothetical protein
VDHIEGKGWPIPLALVMGSVARTNLHEPSYAFSKIMAGGEFKGITQNSWLKLQNRLRPSALRRRDRTAGTERIEKKQTHGLPKRKATAVIAAEEQLYGARRIAVKRYEAPW